MSESERHQVDFPGFLRTSDGKYVKHDDFLAFIAGAAPAKKAMSVRDRAIAWLRRQGVNGEFETLGPEEVSRLATAAQKAILAKRGRGQRPLASDDSMVAPPEFNGDERPEGMS